MKKNMNFGNANRHNKFTTSSMSKKGCLKEINSLIILLYSVMMGQQGAKRVAVSVFIILLYL